MDLNQCMCSGKSLPRLLRPSILALLVRSDAYGYYLVQCLREMKQFEKKTPDTSGVYKALKQMEEEGLITSSWDLGESGPARRCYSLTDNGKSCLQRWALTIAEYKEQIEALLFLVESAEDNSDGKVPGQCCCKKIETIEEA